MVAVASASVILGWPLFRPVLIASNSEATSMSSFSCASDGPTEYEPIICDTLTRSTFGGCEPGATPGTCWPLRAITTWRRAA
ncbi:hypothetical protein G6F59_017902 [Rhizopus arrhizus]|nr:hypothetical protein G6F59_017902 [Rhizopus arrhizus]